MSDAAPPPTDDEHLGDDEPTSDVADDGMAPLIDNTGLDDNDPAAPSG
jgi:hypothetical protein